MKSYQVVGWYKSLALEHIGKSTTISDGASFEHLQDALNYGNDKMSRFTIKEHDNPTHLHEIGLRGYVDLR
jgi:hypothetical protein|tara:strand:+ start:32 stop:244 length:213 start_codon:yes stop_codon:yes gene_type:complete